MTEYLAPYASVIVNGRRFDSWLEEDLIAASVDLTTDKTGEGTVEIFDPNFKYLDSLGCDKPIPGNFTFGWKEMGEARVFGGQLARVEWRDDVTILRFHDASVAMKQIKKGRYHVKKTDVQMLNTFAADNGLGFELRVADFQESEPFDAVMQAARTDWQKALHIAHKSGLRLFVEGGTLVAVQAGTVKTGRNAGTLEFKKDFKLLRGFQLGYKVPENKKGKHKLTEYRGRKAAAERLTGDHKVPPIGTIDLVVGEDLLKHSTRWAKTRAKAKADRRREFAYEHQIKTLAEFRRLIRLRDTVTLLGIGGFFSNEYIVTDIRYDFRAGSLTSELTVGRDGA
jgi:phage protein D